MAGEEVSFLVTKHSWKGRYKRVLSVGVGGVATYTPDKLDLTNRWSWGEVSTLAVARHASATTQDFILVLKKEKKVETLKFSSEYRSLILTEAFNYRHLFADKPKDVYRYDGYKQHWSDMKLPVSLEVRPCALAQVDPATRDTLAIYPYHDMQGVLGVTDYEGGFVVACGTASRLHMFATPKHQELIAKMLEMANLTLNVTIKHLPAAITVEDFRNQRFGKFSGDMHLTSLAEFDVRKVRACRHREAVRRILCLTETCIVERDVGSYKAVCCRGLESLWAVVLAGRHGEKITLEWTSGESREYVSGEGEAVCASIVESARAAGTRRVHVRSHATPMRARLHPRSRHADEDTEANVLRLLQNPGNLSRLEVLERFNVNVDYNGLNYSVNQEKLFAENKEKLIVQAMNAVMTSSPGADCTAEEMEAQFQCLRRLHASRPGFAALTALPQYREWLGAATVHALRSKHTAASHAAVDALATLMQPMHADPDLRQEQLNKASLLSSAPFLRALLDLFTELVEGNTGALLVSALLDLFTFAVCAPYSETTDSRQFDQLLEMIAQRGHLLFKLFEHVSPAIVRGAGLVTRALVEEGGEGGGMQTLALAECALPRHLLHALFPAPRRHHHKHLARHLLALLHHAHEPAHRLLERSLPPALLAHLQSTETAPHAALDAAALDQRDNLALAAHGGGGGQRAHDWQRALHSHVKHIERHLEQYTSVALQHWASRALPGVPSGSGTGAGADRPVTLRRRREHVKPHANWPMFYYQFDRDHYQPDLIWNHTTREELRACLEAEVRAWAGEREACALEGERCAWNHAEFSVPYPSLQNELRVHNYYLRVLLDRRDDQLSPIAHSYEFFNELYHRYLTSPKAEMKCMCLQAMAIVYKRHHETIGPFADTKHLIGQLERCVERAERDRLVQLLSALVLNSENVPVFVSAGGARTLVELAALAHTHHARPPPPQANNLLTASEKGQETRPDRQPEWYYSEEGGERKGPLSLVQLTAVFEAGTIGVRTRVWSAGMEGWRALAAVPQLKWVIVARGTALLDPTQLACVAIDTLLTAANFYPARDSRNALIRPLPRIKRLLADPNHLPHIVQLLLTFEPRLVDKVCSLLCEVLADNPEISKLYLTGAFYFALMYPGSNVSGIAKLLHLAHMRQASARDASGDEIARRSALGQLLPDAMVCYLHNHGPDMFAQIFLGEYDSPEAIWNSDMRKMLIMKIAGHVGEWSGRLGAVCGARYPYLAIPAVRYPQLEAEVFCGGYYLRHFCNEARFPSWPVSQPAMLVRCALAGWRAEEAREPPPMSVAEALQTLGLEGEQRDETAVRRAYYRLAQLHHPDKNPAGRERFEAVCAAYEFLCSRESWAGSGPDPQRVALYVRAQRILYTRYQHELGEYKYAGYGLWARAMRAALAASGAGSELVRCLSGLAHATLAAAPLNAEELRREGGLPLLVEALGGTREPAHAAPLAGALAVAAGSRDCRAQLAPLAHLPAYLLPLVQDKSACEGGVWAAMCVGRLSARGAWRVLVARAGGLHVLLRAALRYDYTLHAAAAATADADATASGATGGGQAAPSATDNGAQLDNIQEGINAVSVECIRAVAQLYRPAEQDAAADEDADAEAVARWDERVRLAVRALLTPYLADRITRDEPHEVLETLQRNSKTPYLIWDNSTRAQLVDALSQIPPTEHDGPLIPPGFRYKAHEGLIMVGDIYPQVYVECSGAALERPAHTCAALASFLRQRTPTTDREHLLNAVKALALLLRNYPEEGGTISNDIDTLVSLAIDKSGSREATQAALEAFTAALAAPPCLEAALKPALACQLLPLLLTDHALHALKALTPLANHSRHVREACSKGLHSYLLYLIAKDGPLDDVREAAADLLSKHMADKLEGGIVRAAVSRRLPALLVEAVREQPAEAVRTLHCDHRHPELVWDEKLRAKLRERLDKEVSALMKGGASVEPACGEEWWAGEEGGGAVVGGVHLALYLASPAWPVRAPRRFLLELLPRALDKHERDEPAAELYMQALVVFLERGGGGAGAEGAGMGVREAVAASGGAERIARLAAAHNPGPPLLVLAALAKIGSARGALACTRVPHAIVRALHEARGAEEAARAMHALYATAHDEQLLAEALESGLVEGACASLARLSGAGAALVAAALQHMAAGSGAGSERVRSALGGCPAWRQYAHQRHELFIAPGGGAPALLPAAPPALAPPPSLHPPPPPPPLH